MSSIRLRYLGFGIGLAAAGSSMVACGSDASPSGSGSGAGGGAGFMGVSGSPGSGGAMVGAGGTGTVGSGGATVGSGGTVGAGGGASSGGGPAIGGSTSKYVITGSITKCPDAVNAPDIAFPTCTSDKCLAAHCVPNGALPPGTDAKLLGKCDDANSCVPDDYIAVFGKFLPKTCKSLLGAEGRCISSCVPQVAQQYDQLPKDTCNDTEKCAPCFNPIDGTDTGACKQGCDTGPKDPTVKKFSSCGAGLGVCVPPTLVADPDQLNALKGADDPTAKCPEKDDAGNAYLCAPTLKANDQKAPFVVCTPTSIGGGLGLPNKAGQKGACVPKYLPSLFAQGLLLQDTCKTGELCAPCTNPLSTPTANAPSGACPWP